MAILYLANCTICVEDIVARMLVGIVPMGIIWIIKKMNVTQKNKSSKYGIWLIILLALFFLILIVASWWVNKVPLSDKEYPTTKGNTVTYILIDGLAKHVFDQKLAEHQLPHIQSLIDKGIYVPNGISSFPTMTGYGYYPFIAGQDATQSGVYGLRWFDRKRDEGNLRNYVGRTNVLMNEDMNRQYKNAFELSGDQYTASVNTFMNRGVKENIVTGWQLSSAKFFKQTLFKSIHAIPYFGEKIVFDYKAHETHVMNIGKAQLTKNPKVQWLTLPCLDALNHIEGTTPEYGQLLVHIDSLIGDFISEIDRLGQSPTRALAIITDHGVQDVNKNLDLRAQLKKLDIDMERGESIHIMTDELTTPLTDFVDQDGYLVVNGNLSNYLYFKDPNKEGVDAWREKLLLHQLESYSTTDKKVNLLEYIANVEGVDIIAAQKDDSTVLIRREDAIAKIINRKGKWRYEIALGDPLFYSTDSLASKLLDGKYYTPEQWLEASSHSQYPDAVYRVGALMLQEGVGDILVCSQAGYDLAADYEIFVGNYRGGHGGLHTELIKVPYVIYFPGKGASNINVARSEDIGARVLEYLGF